MARYLGPAEFGLLNYIISWASIFTVISTLGLDSILARDLVRNPKSSNKVLGTAATLQAMCGFMTYLLLNGIIFYIRPGDYEARAIAAILGFINLFKAIEVIRYWFESRLESKYTVLFENFVFILFAAIKFIFIYIKAPLIYFAFALMFESAAIGVALFIIFYLRGNSIFNWNFKKSTAYLLLKDSWPFILSSMAVVIYIRIDTIMIGQMLGDKEVGIYSVSTRLAEAWYFIPGVIVASVFPSIVSAKSHPLLYSQRFQSLLNSLCSIAIAIAICTSFLAPYMILLLFGRAYEAADSVLAINTWAGVFVFIGVASGRWFLVENLQRLLIVRTILGAVINILLNWILIPKLGMIGAAWATLISQAVANVFANLADQRTRPLFRMQIRSFVWLFKGRFI